MRALRDVVQGELVRLGWKQRVIAANALRVWDRVVGAELARHTFPESMRNGKLTVLVSDHLWLHQLSYFRTDLVRRLRQETGGRIADVIFQVGEIPVSPSASGPVTAPRGPTRPPAVDLEEALERVVVAASHRQARLEAASSGTISSGTGREGRSPP